MTKCVKSHSFKGPIYLSLIDFKGVNSLPDVVLTHRVKGYFLAITKTEIRERKTQIGESSSDARRVEADRRR